MLDFYMLTIEEVNQRRPRCKKCGCLYDLVKPIEVEQRLQLYAYFKQSDFVRFVKHIREFTSCSLGEAKATYLHLAAAGRFCHRCKESLASGSCVDCGKCKSLNLVWDDENI
jgi:hypothetical protein